MKGACLVETSDDRLVEALRQLRQTRVMPNEARVEAQASIRRALATVGTLPRSSRPIHARSRWWTAAAVTAAVVCAGWGIHDAVAVHRSGLQPPVTKPSTSIAQKPQTPTYTRDSAVLFAGLPFTTHVPPGMVARRMKTHSTLDIRYYRADRAGGKPDTLQTIDIVIPKQPMSGSEAQAWLDQHEGAGLLQRTYPPSPDHSVPAQPFAAVYAGYLKAGQDSLRYREIDVVHHDGQYLFIVSAYPSDAADMMVPYLQRILGWWTWSDGTRLDAQLPQASGPVHGT